MVFKRIFEGFNFSKYLNRMFAHNNGLVKAMEPVENNIQVDKFLHKLN
jgi:hypothetical protein